MEKAKLDEILKLSAEILKSWTPEPGKVTPFSSGSSINDNQISDNHLEHYVKESPKDVVSESVSAMFNSDFWMNGGDKMTEKTFDVDNSTTSQQQYNNPGTSTTEPDPLSNIAITKAERPNGAADVEGQATVGTTANTTVPAPSAGETTEPETSDSSSMKKGMAQCDHCGGDTCPDCNKAMHLCMCDGMQKSAKDGDQDSTASDDEKSEVAPDDEKVEKADTCSGCNKPTSECSCENDGIQKAIDYFAKKEFSESRRKNLAHSGKAMPDGSFPIESEEDLKNAIKAVGRAKNYDKAKAHIISRAKALGKTSLLPEDWTKTMQKSQWGNAFLPVD